jgi:hypothetical protein
MPLNLIEELKNFKPSDTFRSVLSAEFGITPQKNAVLVQNGFWHVLFFANQYLWADDESDWIGVRIIPNLALQDSPVVSVNQFGASTISPTLKNFIPNWILHTRIEKGSFEHVNSEWSNVKIEMKEAHLNFGGDLDLFNRFDAFISDTQNFQTEGYIERSSRAFEFLKVDQSIQTVQFREFIQKLILDQTLLPEFKNDFGAWNDYARSAIAARAYFLRGGEQRTLLDTVQSMWLGFDKPAPFDDLVFFHIEQCDMSRNPANNIHSLAFATTRSWSDEPPIPESIQKDPLFPAAQALASFDHASGYKGVEHMEAAAKLDLDLNDGKRSYEALISASFWSAMNLGFPYKESYQASLLLARKYGWDEMLELLEMNEFDIQNA